MECPFCYTNFEYRLSICPHCGKTDDPIYQELFSRVKPRKIVEAEASTPPVEAAETVEAYAEQAFAGDKPAAGPVVIPVMRVMEEARPESAPAVTAAPVAPTTVETPRERPAITTEIRSKNTCNTLVDFPGLKPELPEWRQELQSKLKEIQEQRQVAATGTNGGARAEAAEAIMAKRHAIGATGLAMALLEEPKAPKQSPLIEKALRRIEESRQKHETQEQTNSYHSSNAAPAYKPAPSYSPVPTAPTRPASLYRGEGESAPTQLRSVRMVEPEEWCDDDGPRPFIFSEGETVESRLSTIGQNHSEKLARAAEIKDDLLSGQKFDTNRLRKFNAVVSYADGENTATATVKFRTETVAPKTMRPREGRVEREEELAVTPEPETIPVVNIEDAEREEIAPFVFRFNAGLFDFIISGFLSLIILSPFIMLGGNFFNVEGAFAFLVTCSIVMFLYITAAVGLLGRTLGMGLFSLEMIDAEDNDYPTFNQAAVSSCVYLLSLALGGIGFATIFWNKDSRAAHDLLSGTMVVREN
jgi:uncharacterized RDD family membrane protein YckC